MKTLDDIYELTLSIELPTMNLRIKKMKIDLQKIRDYTYKVEALNYLLHFIDDNKELLNEFNLDIKVFKNGIELKSKNNVSKKYDKCKCKNPKFTRIVDENYNPTCGSCGKNI